MELTARLVKIKILVCDVDGVLTDGTIYKGPDGLEFKRFSVTDGAGFFLARAGGLKTALISGRYSAATEARAQELTVDAVYNGVVNKLVPYAEIKQRFGLTDENIAYLGDDLIDVPVMERAGLPIAVKNAYDPVKQQAVYVTEKSGGEGAVREVIDLILQGQGKYQQALENLRREHYGDQHEQQ
ncbi:MAG: HAD hydrolase family protein [Candidatus Neomarinimicrobiota bacterium]